ncbi:MAG TPA: sigma-70 family RNA polymerase sigma factor [Vicinamibacterales bacterium]|nr:sigma-70 family RNA polymerase sigma factor [Vicinamibacterales bacterium]
MSDAGEDFAQLYDRVSGSLYRYALMILASREQAEDVVQEVFATMMRRGVKNLNSVDGYLRTAVRNACYSALRLRRNGVPIAESLLEAIPGGQSAADERVMLEQALRSLPADQREVVHLKIYEGWSFQEIAATTGESVNTVASRYRYGIDKLRTALGERRIG